MRPLHAFVCCALLSAATIVTGLTCHNCFYVELSPSLQSRTDTVVNKIKEYTDGAQDPVCAENQIPTSHKMMSMTCKEKPGETARCIMDKALIRTSDSGHQIKGVYRGCSSYTTDKLLNDGCHKGKTESAVIKYVINFASEFKRINTEQELCLSSSDQASPANTAAGNPALFSLFVTIVYLFI